MPGRQGNGTNKDKLKNIDLQFNYLNINGLAGHKIIEIENITGKNTITILVETHRRHNKLEIKDSFYKIEKWREKDSKKGGGIMILYTKDSNIEVEEIETPNEDIMNIKINLLKQTIYASIQYWSVSDIAKNQKIKEDTEAFINKYQKEELMIIGDMNAHLEWLDGRKNNNSELFLDLVESNQLVILNTLELCKGKYTRTMNDINTTIDYALVNEKMMHRIRSMEIDDQKLIDISDHNLISISLKDYKDKNKKPSKMMKERKEFWQIKNKAKMEGFKEGVLQEMEHFRNGNLEGIEEIMKNQADIHLKTIMGKKATAHRSWAKMETIAKIKQRRRINRQIRNERNIIEKNRLKEEYNKIKKEIQDEVRESIKDEELKIASAILQDKNKKVWEII